MRWRRLAASKSVQARSLQLTRMRHLELRDGEGIEQEKPGGGERTRRRRWALVVREWCVLTLDVYEVETTALHAGHLFLPLVGHRRRPFVVNSRQFGDRGWQPRRCIRIFHLQRPRDDSFFTGRS